VQVKVHHRLRRAPTRRGVPEPDDAATMANGGGYLEPLLVSRIEDRDGRVIEDFSPQDPDIALEPDVAYTLLDNLRGAINRGTGRDIRSRYGIRADVAGKTGTTRAPRTAGSS
jgi:penicillin-binding protein 1A